MPVATFILPASLALQLLSGAAPAAKSAPKAVPAKPIATAKRAAPVYAQATAEKLIGPALTDGHAYARLAELTDGIGPRLSGSPGAEAAVQWALRSFKADGVKAWLEPVKVPHWVRGEASGDPKPNRR